MNLIVSICSDVEALKLRPELTEEARGVIGYDKAE